jgi:hypothetical protein
MPAKTYDDRDAIPGGCIIGIACHDSANAAASVSKRSS